MDEYALTPEEIRGMRNVLGTIYNGELHLLYFVVNDEDIRTYGVGSGTWGQKSADSYWSYWDSEAVMCITTVLTPEEAIDIIFNGKSYDAEKYK